MPTIAEIDPNFRIETKIDRPDIRFIDVRKCEELDFYGLYNPRTEDVFRRMPTEVTNAVSVSVAARAEESAGGRLRFCTDSGSLAIHTVMPGDGKPVHGHGNLTNRSGFDLYLRADDGTFSYFHTFIPPVDRGSGYEGVVNFPDRRMRELLLVFPDYDRVSKLFLGLQEDARITHGGRYTYETPVVYYGSSITQGGCASRPGTTYQEMISRELDCDYVNLGFSGSARGEQTMCDYLAGLDMSVFFLDYDHNAPTAEELEKTHENVYRTVRRAHPETPIIMASKTDPPVTEGAREQIEKRRAIIRATYEKAVAEGDKNVYFIDGQTVFPGRGGDSCTVDGCHPNDLGFRAMADVFGDVIRKVIK
ncbi:MAG: hypothetical protein IKM07_00280 [Clostridia bacterium]|nr:hypothetical protein [Clostridia bacterium]